MNDAKVLVRFVTGDPETELRAAELLPSEVLATESFRFGTGDDRKTYLRQSVVTDIGAVGSVFTVVVREKKGHAFLAFLERVDGSMGKSLVTAALVFLPLSVLVNWLLRGAYYASSVPPEAFLGWIVYHLDTIVYCTLIVPLFLVFLWGIFAERFLYGLFAGFLIFLLLPIAAVLLSLVPRPAGEPSVWPGGYATYGDHALASGRMALTAVSPLLPFIIALLQVLGLKGAATLLGGAKDSAKATAKGS